MAFFLQASFRRIASDGDYGFNRKEANKQKQYAKSSSSSTISSSISSSEEASAAPLLINYFNDQIIAKWKTDDKFFDEFVMNDDVWEKAMTLSKIVYGGAVGVTGSSSATLMADTGAVLAANFTSFASLIKDKSIIFLGIPENVSLLQKRVAIHTKSPSSAALLYKSKLFQDNIRSRIVPAGKVMTKKEMVAVDFIEDRFKKHVETPFRPSLFERYGTTVDKEEVEAGSVFGTFSASNTHGKMITHFTRVACNKGYINSIALNPSLAEEQDRESTSRTLLNQLFEETVREGVGLKGFASNPDAGLLYGNRVDTLAFARLVEGSIVKHGIVPGEFTRDMERTPYLEISEEEGGIEVGSERFSYDGNGVLTSTTETVFLKFNAGQMMCDIVFGNDWDLHLKDYLSILGHESFDAYEDENGKMVLKNKMANLLLDHRRLGRVDIALVLASNHIKQVAQEEVEDRINGVKTGRPSTTGHKKWKISDHIRAVVGHIFFELFEEEGLKRICSRLSANFLGGGTTTPKETVLGELEEVTGNLLLAKIVDSLHMLRNQDVPSVLYNITIKLGRDGGLEKASSGNKVYTDNYASLSLVPPNSLAEFGMANDSFSVAWDSTSRMVVSVKKNIRLVTDASDMDEEIKVKYDKLLRKIKSYSQLIKTKVPESRFFNYKEMYMAIKSHADIDGSPPIKHRFYGLANVLPSPPTAAPSVSEKITASSILSGIRDALETGALRGSSRDVETTVVAMSDDTLLVSAVGAGPEDIALRDLVSSSIVEQSTKDLLVMRDDVHGIATATLVESGDSVVSVMRDLKGNKVTFSDAMGRMGITTDPAIDAEFAREMEEAYPEGAIGRWEERVAIVSEDLPSSQIEKLQQIEEDIDSGVLSGDEEIADSINDTELSRATDSVLKRSLSGGVKVLTGRFVAIVITGTVVGVLGTAVTNVIHASRGAHYNVKDASTGELKSYKILRFSCYDQEAGNGYVTIHPFEEKIDATIDSDADFRTEAGAFVVSETDANNMSNFKAHAPICGDLDKQAGLCGRWAHYWTGSVLPWVEPMSSLVRGTSLSCDKGSTVTGAVAEVLGSAAADVIGTIFDTVLNVAGKATASILSQVVSSPAFVIGVPAAVGITSTGFNLSNWKRGVAVAVGLLVLLLIVRFFAGTGQLTLESFQGTTAGEDGTSNVGGSEALTVRSRLKAARTLDAAKKAAKKTSLDRIYTKEDKKRIEEIGIESTSGNGSNGLLKNYEVIRPVFGIARPSQEMTYYHIGLLY